MIVDDLGFTLRLTQVLGLRSRDVLLKSLCQVSVPQQASS